MDLTKFDKFMMEAKPGKLGSVWVARAKILDKNKKTIGSCMDTPNAIAKCFMEQPKAQFVKSSLGGKVEPRDSYKDRMADWNTAQSQFSK